MTIYVPGKVTLRQTWQPMDPDAAAYITAVETADGQALEEKVKIAIDNFVLGCKADGIWSAIKASCILAGARTLDGALVPLVGTAPTNYNFVSGDYNRETGLVGDGSTKYLDSNRNNNADPQDNNHNSVYVTTVSTGVALGIAGTPSSGNNVTGLTTIRNRSNTSTTYSMSPGFVGHTRSTSASFNYRNQLITTAATVTSQTPQSGNLNIFLGGSTYGDHRIAFYSIGESLNLARLDARVTDLINAIGVAIP